MDKEFIKAQDGARTVALKSIATSLASIDTTLKGILAKLGEQAEETAPAEEQEPAPTTDTAPTTEETPTTETPTTETPTTDEPQPGENQGEGGEN